MSAVRGKTVAWRLYAGAMVVGLVALVAGGCQKSSNNPVAPATDPATTAVLNAAAATNISNALSSGSFGAVNQVGDLGMLTDALAAGGFPGPIIEGHGGAQVDSSVKSYDSATGWWTFTLFRMKSNDNHLEEFERTVELQFLNKSNTAQKFWLVGNDTAYSIHFKIVSGSGVHSDQHGTDRLVSLSGDWMATGANTPMLTINTVSGGDYMRVNADTMSHDEKFRTSNSTLDLKFTDVTVPRGDNDFDHLDHGITGTITGTYHAVITFQQDSSTVTTTIDRTIDITLGQGNAHFHLGGDLFDADLGGGGFHDHGPHGPHND